MVPDVRDQGLIEHAHFATGSACEQASGYIGRNVECPVRDMSIGLLIRQRHCGRQGLRETL